MPPKKKGAATKKRTAAKDAVKRETKPKKEPKPKKSPPPEPSPEPEDDPIPDDMVQETLVIEMGEYICYCRLERDVGDLALMRDRTASVASVMRRLGEMGDFTVADGDEALRFILDDQAVPNPALTLGEVMAWRDRMYHMTVWVRRTAHE